MDYFSLTTLVTFAAAGATAFVPSVVPQRLHGLAFIVCAATALTALSLSITSAPSPSLFGHLLVAFTTVVASISVAAACLRFFEGPKNDQAAANPLSSVWTQLASRHAAKAKAKAAEYDSLLQEGRALFHRKITSQNEFLDWSADYKDWLQRTEDSIRRNDGHSAAGNFKRGLSLFLSLHLDDSFTPEHDAQRTVLSHKLENLTRLLEWAKDDPYWGD